MFFGPLVIAGAAAVICVDQQVWHGARARGVESARLGNDYHVKGHDENITTTAAVQTTMLNRFQVHPAISMALLDAVRWHVHGYDK